MNALVSLVDHDHAEQIRAIWSELEARYGVRSRYVNPFVHFSYHVVADEYDLEQLGPTLEDTGNDRVAFHVPTSGVEVFTGSEPVVFVSVARTPELDDLHRHIWDHCAPGFGVGLPYYAPEVWVPHITLAQGPRTAEHLTEIVQFLEGRDLLWDLLVDNLAVIEDGGRERGLLQQVALAT